ncbi:MAG TPA: hypothetical protein VG367_11695 [Mucilaginibacter sp.]|jgi:hypothetical protein|nr:hypothetical protein [Mucilaginibacter sp.]
MSTRRKFLKQFSLGTASLAVFNEIPYKPKSSVCKHLHIKETNFTLAAIAPSVIGFIYTDSPEKINKHINELRAKNHYKKTLSFRSTDKYKLPFAMDLIDYFFDEPSLHFYARVVDRVVDLKRNDINLIHDIEYRVNYRKAIQDLKELTNADVFYLDFITQPSEFSDPGFAFKNEIPYITFKTSKNQLVKYLNSHEHTVDVEIEPHHRNNLSQMADFFTGNIYGDVIGIENKTKWILLEHLKRKLGVKKLSHMYNSNVNKRFIISSIHK